MACSYSHHRIQVGQFIKLPEEIIGRRRIGGRTGHHAEENFFPAPMNLRIAHVNADAVLDAVRAEAGFAREIDKAGVRGHQPQITAARGVRRVRLLVAKNRHDGEKRV